MTEDELYAHIFGSAIFKKWHWFRYHFEHRLRGSDHPFAEAFVQACLDCEAVLPGFAKTMSDNVASICGLERHEPHYEQLLQRLAELHVIRQVLTYRWPEGVKFTWEPTTGATKKNPEISIETFPLTVGVEVKSPSLFKHINQRGANRTQIVARNFDRQTVMNLTDPDEQITMPRDNPVKDFLVSANDKFAAFKDGNDYFFGVLVVVWDDFIYEPISALVHPASGLLTDNSFAMDERGRPMRFPHVDGVIVVPHVHQLLRATRDEPLLDNCQDAFDYGRPNQIPFKAMYFNPYGSGIPDMLLDCLQASIPEPTWGAEYQPKDIVWWMPI